MTHTKPGSRTRAVDENGEVVDLTGTSLVDENPSPPVEDVPRPPMTGEPITEDLGFDEVGPGPMWEPTAEPEGIGSKVQSFMSRRPWLAVAGLVVLGFLLRRMLPRSRPQPIYQPALIEIPPGARLRASVVDG